MSLDFFIENLVKCCALIIDTLHAVTILSLVLLIAGREQLMIFEGNNDNDVSLLRVSLPLPRSPLLSPTPPPLKINEIKFQNLQNVFYIKVCSTLFKITYSSGQIAFHTFTYSQ